MVIPSCSKPPVLVLLDNIFLDHVLKMGARVVYPILPIWVNGKKIMNLQKSLTINICKVYKKILGVTTCKKSFWNDQLQKDFSGTTICKIIGRNVFLSKCWRIQQKLSVRLSHVLIGDLQKSCPWKDWQKLHGQKSFPEQQRTIYLFGTTICLEEQKIVPSNLQKNCP